MAVRAARSDASCCDGSGVCASKGDADPISTTNVSTSHSPRRVISESVERGAEPEEDSNVGNKEANRVPVLYQSDFYQFYVCCRAAQPEQGNHIKESYAIKHRKRLPTTRSASLPWLAAMPMINAFTEAACGD